jgi:hypothetical protein
VSVQQTSKIPVPAHCPVGQHICALLTPPQHDCPAGQQRLDCAPAVQAVRCSPVGQATPQSPLLQVSPAGHVATQVRFEQHWPLGQEPQAPFEQHWPLGQELTHAPFEQHCPLGHEPQIPLWQHCPLGQDATQVPLEQHCPLAQGLLASQAATQMPLLLATSRRPPTRCGLLALTQTPLSQHSPLGHGTLALHCTHTPLSQNWPPEQLVTQVPPSQHSTPEQGTLALQPSQVLDAVLQVWPALQSPSPRQPQRRFAVQRRFVVLCAQLTQAPPAPQASSSTPVRHVPRPPQQPPFEQA